MNKSNKLFSPKEHMMFEGIYAQAKKQALMVPIMMVYTALALTLLVGLGLLDYELYFQIFDYLNGDDSYWSSKLMALTGIVMIVAFHLLAKSQPNHWAVGAVKMISAVIIIAFILGGGFYISQMLYNDGMGEPTISMPVLMGDMVNAETGQNWIDVLFEHFTTPFAIMTLSLGIGGLSIVALFVTHHLITMISKNASIIFVRLSTLYSVKALLGTIKSSETSRAALKQRDATLSFRNELFFQQQIGEDVLELISKNLLPHEQALQEAMIFEPKHRWEFDKQQTEEMKKVSAMIKKIRAITLSDIIKGMSLPKTLRN